MFALAILSKLFQLAKTPPLSYIFSAVVFVLAIYLYGVYQYRQGASDKEAEYQIIIEQKIKQIDEANKFALDQANRKIKQLMITMEQRDDLLKDIDKEVGDKPNNGITSDSVRRLNQLR